MNAAIHANISARKWGTEDKSDWDHFYKLHDFMDCSKELIANNLHRIFTHSMYWVKRVMIPIFGHSYQLKGINKVYNTKDDMESSHIVADFHGKFLPSLSDYFDLVEDSPDDEQRFRDFREDNKRIFQEYPTLEELFLSPLYATGWVKSLWMTHNSWFLGTILPLIPEYKGIAREIRNYRENSPTILFNRMRYADWVQNGNGCPPSYAKVFEFRQSKQSNSLRNSHQSSSLKNSHGISKNEKCDKDEDDLSVCEQCEKRAWNGRICYLCGAKNKG